MLSITKYREEHFPFLKSWVTDAALLFQFAGREFIFPLTPEQIHSYQKLYPERGFYICLDEQNDPVAFGEIIPQPTNNPRLGRLLVGGEHSRGKGIGAKFISLLIEECKRLYHPEAVELYVFDGNTRAINCYHKCGFYFISEPPLIVHDNDKKFTAKKMRLRLKNGIES